MNKKSKLDLYTLFVACAFILSGYNIAFIIAGVLGGICAGIGMFSVLGLWQVHDFILDKVRKKDE